MGGCCILGITTALGAEEFIKIYDQVFTPKGDNPDSSGYYPIKTNSPIGQSFTPQLTRIDFVELHIGQVLLNPPPGEQTLSLALRTGDIAGPIVAVTAPVTLQPREPSKQVQTFEFVRPLTLQPGSLYTFELRSESGEDLFAVGLPFSQGSYDHGTMFFRGVAVPSQDLWFREGLIVPEPGTIVLVALGGGLVLACRRLRPQ